MKTRLALLLSASLIAAGAFAAGTTDTATVADGRFGDAIPADARITTLGAAVEGYAADGGDQAISGRVGQVCQKGGCWMTLSDGDAIARVMTDHKFVLPKDLSGDVVVFGALQAIDLDEKEVAHMAEDSGKPKSEIATREYRIAARGVARR
jgi:hypothetical protein